MAYQTRTRDTTEVATLGYDPIPLHRPKFIYFEFTGLRPSVPHWMFFGGKEITNFVNTSYTRADFDGAGRNSALKEAGEQFVNATQFPTGGGLAYGGATAAGGASAPLYSSANGIIKGVFYLQSNATYNWSINTSGTELMVKDTLSIQKENTLSLGTALFKGIGQYENYWQWTGQETYEEWVEPARDISSGGSGNSNGDDNDLFTTVGAFNGEAWVYTTTNNRTGDQTRTASQAKNQSGGLAGSFAEIGSKRKKVPITKNTSDKHSHKVTSIAQGSKMADYDWDNLFG